MKTSDYARHLRALEDLASDLWTDVASGGDTLNKASRDLAAKVSVLDAGLRCHADDAGRLLDTRRLLKDV